MWQRGSSKIKIPSPYGRSLSGLGELAMDLTSIFRNLLTEIDVIYNAPSNKGPGSAGSNLDAGEGIRMFSNRVFSLSDIECVSSSPSVVMENCVSRNWNELATSFASLEHLKELEFNNQVSFDGVCLALSQSKSI